MSEPRGCLACNHDEVHAFLLTKGADPSRLIQCPPTRHAWNDVMKPCAECGATFMLTPVKDVAPSPTDLEPRLALLRAASRPDEPLTDRNGPTAQGNIISAITKLERERALVMTRKKP